MTTWNNQYGIMPADEMRKRMDVTPRALRLQEKARELAAEAVDLMADKRAPVSLCRDTMSYYPDDAESIVIRACVILKELGYEASMKSGHHLQPNMFLIVGLKESEENDD